MSDTVTPAVDPAEDFMTRKLKPGGVAAEFVFVDQSGKEETLLQSGAGYFDPAREVVPFLIAAAAAVHAGVAKPTLPVPWGNLNDGQAVPLVDAPVNDRLKQAKEAPADPLARLLWNYWTQLHTPAAFAKKYSFAPKTIGYRWKVWYNTNGTLDASFQALDPHGKVVDSFDFDRRPVGELPAAMLATETVAAILGQYAGGT